MDIRRRLGARIRELRTMAKLSQERLGERAGVSYKFLGEVERGQGNPTIDTLARIAAALDVDITDLLAADAAVARYQFLSPTDFTAVRELRDSLDHFMKRTRSRKTKR